MTTIWVVYLVSVLTSIALAALLWRHRDRSVARALLWYVLAGLLWGGLHLVNLAVRDPRASIAIFRVFYLVVALGPLTLFVFALVYTGRDRYLQPWLYALLAVHPVLVTIFAVVNPGNTFFASIEYDPAPGAGLVYEFGPAFWVHSAYSYALVAASVLLFLDLLRRNGSLYRVQTVLLVGGATIPGAFTALSVAIDAGVDLTPVGIPIASGLLTIAIVRYRLIDLLPIARAQVLDSIADGVFVVDEDDRIVDVNQAGRRLANRFGVDEEPIVGQRFDAFVDRSRLPETVTELSADDDRTIEASVGDHHFSLTARGIERSRGRRIGWHLLVRDVTERHQRESQLRRQNDRLDSFASLVSHDLRNPLNVADGYLDLARESGDEEHFDEIERSHARMEAIIEDVLTLTREGSSATDREVLPVSDLATDAWDSVETDGASLEVRSDATIEADPGRASRLLENLFRNALEHGATDGDDLTVSVGDLDGDGRQGFYVADDGQGIPPAERDAILEEGYSTKESGTGLGLSIVAEIAAAHDWFVNVAESDAGGARFEFAWDGSGTERTEPDADDAVAG